MADEYQSLRLEKNDGIATITISHPPINLFDVALMGELDRAGREVEADPNVRVVVVQSDDFPADLAERYGRVNRALPPEELRPFVQRLARQIASFPADAIARAKAAVIAGEPQWEAGLAEESNQFDRCLANREARRRMEEFMKNGGQTREAEARDLVPLLSR